MIFGQEIIIWAREGWIWSEQHGLVEGILPMEGGLEPDELSGPFQPKSLHDSVIGWAEEEGRRWSIVEREWEKRNKLKTEGEEH